MTKEKKLNLIRYAVWALFLLIAFLAQSTKGLAVEIGQAHLCFVIPTVICICMFEKEKAGCWFGLAGGLLMDLTSPVIPGYNALMLLITGTAVGLLITNLLRNTLLTAFVFCSVSLFLYESFYWLFFVFLKGTVSPSGIYWSNYFMTFFWSTLLLVVPVYLIFRAVNKALRTA